MLFNSIDFAFFLPIVFVLYWFVFNKNTKLQNILVVLASYIFYGWWNSKFLFLIAFSTLVDYTVARAIDRQDNAIRRKILLWASIFVNLGLLGFFKYYNFFLDNFISAFSFLGIHFKADSLSIILPVGISFYTFQTLSYTIDVYKGKIQSTKDFVAFAAFVSFFPQLVAGPIERAVNLLPQFHAKRIFDYASAVDGMRQILWGLFKKIVIADNCAEYANLIFNHSNDYTGGTLVLGVFFFAFQIYADFSGYSDIAIGTARLFGFTLMRNFAFPYFSRNIGEFWRRWHISLSTWFRDYLYIPLGGSKGSVWMKIRNTFIIFIVSGFWHGANWTFIIWGALNAFYFLPLLLTKTNRTYLDTVAHGKYFPTFKEFSQMFFTFGLTLFAWIFFRAENLHHALHYISSMFSGAFFIIPSAIKCNGVVVTLILIIFFFIVEWFGREGQYGIANIDSILSKPLRWVTYSFLIFLIGMYMRTEETPFIYFQF